MRLADRVVVINDVRKHPDRYSSLFGRARSEVGHGICLCRTDETVRLVIRCRVGRYHLATWPAGGHQHAPGCSWYRSPSSMSGRSTYAEAISTTDTGTAIRLSTPLTVRGAAADKPAARRAESGVVQTARRSMGLLALLHFLWESARLNVWQPRGTPRDWRTCRTLLEEQADDCRVNQQPLTEALWIVPPFQREHSDRINTGWERFLGALVNVGRVRRRGLVIGEIRDIEKTQYGERIRLAHQRAPLYLSTKLMDRVRRSYPSAFSELATRSGRRQVVLCLVERSPRGYPTIVDLAAMLTNSSYLPADSSHEAEMADALVAAGRAFVKPLHYDGTEVFPDFVLIDDDPETYVEVWGVRGRESYEDRKRAKQALYRAAGRTLLEWDVRGSLPPLTRD
ncbi:DUF1173 domain-containing protein [Amycolatopsis roodepoortensis]|uniref:DUF1173 domain-containing protein n=1 Tax=Amycolatopsis roodepoortensis TaxID=700274 RepID=UPI00214AF3F6|nr:DUF1173 domain-containing protein [Amycolatopsis roodepoortensis]UUV32086.1 DUF1173 domain-containing protein [Amycolatopsis roodepoortensis]